MSPQKTKFNIDYLKGTVTQNIVILKYDYIQCVDVCMLCALKSLVGKLLAGSGLISGSC